MQLANRGADGNHPIYSDIFVYRAEFRSHVRQQRHHPRRQIAILVFDQLCQKPLEYMPSLCRTQPPLHQKAARLIDQSGPILHKPLARPVESLQVDCSSVLIGTKLMGGRVAASAMPSASRSSFLCTFT